MKYFKHSFLILITIAVAKQSNNEKNFLDRMEATEPSTQKELRQLKKDFAVDKNRIEQYYNQEIESLKEQKRKELKDLKTNYGNRIEKLKLRFPDLKKVQREPIKSKGKLKKSIEHTKPTPRKEGVRL